jgi:mono/diheme cytochrome c family protein
VALATPFGTVHGTNLTPDPDTGIGRWSEAAFRRAMRDGVARSGSRLYPVFPFDHYTRASDDDLQALYAFLMTREPVRAEAPANRLMFPLGFRPLLAGWSVLYLDRTAPPHDTRMSAEWNRGAYLTASLGHCSSCHSPRTALGGEDRRRHFDGGEAEGWYVPALNAKSPSPLPWSVEQLTDYLSSGIARDHAIAGGPMQGVVAGLARAAPADVRAIAVYIGSVMGDPTPQRDERAKASVARAERGPLLANAAAVTSGDRSPLGLGAAVYAGACASCHDLGRRLSSGGALQLPLAVAVHDPDPRSLIRIVLRGIEPLDGEPGRLMPAFGAQLTDEQVTALLTFLRQTAAGAPPWPDLAAAVRRAREDEPR